MAFLKDIDEWVFGDFRANRQRVEERHEKKMAEMQSLIDSRFNMNILRQAQIDALNKGRTIYGSYGRGRTAVDPLVEGAVDIGKIQTARAKFEGEETPETAAYFEAAEKSVKDRTGFNKVVEEKGRKEKAKYQKMLEDTAGMVSPEFQEDIRGMFSEGVTPFETPKAGVTKDRPPGKETTAKPIEDYFQAATETVPEENIPRTYEQLGITTAEDMSTFQEMQDAMPDRDLRQEYEDDPESFQRLMKLWREKKLNKKNIRQAFSMIQQKARESLRIA